MRCTALDRRQAASIDSAGSKPSTFMPSASAMSATMEPMAPRPTMPSVLPRSSPPANRAFSFSSSACMAAESVMPPSDCAYAMPGRMPRVASSMPANTSSFTALALAPGVLKTTMPCLP